MSGSNKLYKELKETERNTHMELLLKVWDAFLQKNDPSLLPESIFINDVSCKSIYHQSWYYHSCM